MFKDQISYVIDLLEVLNGSPLPENENLRPVIVVKEIDSDHNLGTLEYDPLLKEYGFHNS